MLFNEGEAFEQPQHSALVLNAHVSGARVPASPRVRSLLLALLHEVGAMELGQFRLTVPGREVDVVDVVVRCPGLDWSGYTTEETP